MKTKHLKSGFAIAAATLTLALYNNFDFFSLGSWSTNTTALDTVNEASRISHARELLGANYKGSKAQKMEGRKSLNEMIRSKVQTSLAPKWKAQSQNIARTVIAESARYKLDPVFVLAVIKTESKFNPVAVGRFGEIGLMQIKPDTAEWIAHKFGIPWNGADTLRNPSTNIRIGLAYMNYLRTQFTGKPVRYVSAYNMGPTNVRRLVAKNVRPAEYNTRVMKNYADLYSRIGDNNITLVAAN